MNRVKIKKAAICLLVLIFSISSPMSVRAQGANINITLEIQNMNILEVFKIISKKSGLNIVAGKNVQGTVSLFLQEVPVREALRTILQAQNLASIEENGIIKIVTESEYLKKFGRPYEDERKMEVFTLKYARAKRVLPLLNDLKSPQGKIIVHEETNTLMISDLPSIMKDIELLLKRVDQMPEARIFQLKYMDVIDLEPILKNFFQDSPGTFNIDERSNQVVVTDTIDRLHRLDNILRELDIQVTQVLIQAKIVEVKLRDEYRQGINWQEVFFEIGGGNTAFSAVAPFGVNPPAGVSALPTFTLGQGGDNLRAVLSLLEQIGKTNLLSSPRVTVLDNKEASLAVATRQPFVSQTVVQTTNSTNTADNVQFVDVGVTLKVEPRISEDGFINLKIRPEVSTSNDTLELEGVANGSNTTFTRTSIPIVTTQELESTVLVKSGTTIVLGGLIQDRELKSSARLPILGSLPGVGRLFQSRSHDYEKVELVIFLTPTIISPDIDTQEEGKFLNERDDLKKFDEVAEEPYVQTHLSPLRFSETGEVPYWKSKAEEV